MGSAGRDDELALTYNQSSRQIRRFRLVISYIISIGSFSTGRAEHGPEALLPFLNWSVKDGVKADQTAERGEAGKHTAPRSIQKCLSHVSIKESHMTTQNLSNWITCYSGQDS